MKIFINLRIAIHSSAVSDSIFCLWYAISMISSVILVIFRGVQDFRSGRPLGYTIHDTTTHVTRMNL